jgi:hypothetical protein
MRQRMIAANLKSQAQLLRWHRERYPKQYKSYSLFYEGSGRDVVMQMWAKYLEWAER